jgi:glycerol-3-phosphate dehydrogenase
LPVSGFDRTAALRRLSTEEFDVLVIGGGITGTGVALDASARGLRTALVEKGDFASGTSSRSSKLVHGGLRYLQQREIALVYESLAERQRLLRNAPHLVRPLPFLIPLFGRDGVVSKGVVGSYATALWLYDITGGWRIGHRHRRVDHDEALSHLTSLRPEALVAGFLYFDAHADDARLTLSVARSAVIDHGAVAANYAGVSHLLTDGNGRVCGARVSPVVMPGTSGSFGDAAEGPEFDVRARVVVNATGVWADGVRALGDPGEVPVLRPAKGVHVTVPSSLLPCDIAAVLPVRGDRRSIFVLPWEGSGRTYIGTTDTEYAGPLDSPACAPEDVDYLLGAVNRWTTTELTRADVTGVWAGLRPLLAPGHGRAVSTRTADLSRRHSVRTAPNGLVTVTGGKLTTYRRMAEDTMRQVLQVMGAGSGVDQGSVTKRLRLHGAPETGAPGTGAPGTGAPGTGAPGTGAPGRATSRAAHRRAGGRKAGEPPAHLAGRYGTEAATVLAMAEGRPDLLVPVVEGLPYLGAEVVFAVRAEMAQTVEDVLARRTRAVLEDARDAAAAADAVARLMAPELGWTPEQAARQAELYAGLVRRDLEGAGVPAALGDRR